MESIVDRMIIYKKCGKCSSYSITRNCGTNVSCYANQRVLLGPLTNKRTGPTLFLVFSRLVLPLQPLFTNDLTSKGVVHLHHLDLDVTPRKPEKNPGNNIF